MSDEETNKKIAESLHQIFPDPATASKVVDLVVRGKPLGWSKRSNAPYYKIQYAEQLRSDVDRMIQSGNDLVYRYETWCGNHEQSMSKNTLYNRINQSLRFLLDNLDTSDKKYFMWSQKVQVLRKPGVGVIIAYLPGYGNQGTEQFKADVVTPITQSPLWQQKLDHWLENNVKAPLCIEGLILTPDEIRNLKTELAAIPGLMVSITSAAIKIIRTAA